MLKLGKIIDRHVNPVAVQQLGLGIGPNGGAINQRAVAIENKSDTWGGDVVHKRAFRCQKVNNLLNTFYQTST